MSFGSIFNGLEPYIPDHDLDLDDDDDNWEGTMTFPDMDIDISARRRSIFWRSSNITTQTPLSVSTTSDPFDLSQLRDASTSTSPYYDQPSSPISVPPPSKRRRLVSADSPLDSPISSFASSNMGNSTSRRMPPSSSLPPPYAAYQGFGSATESSSQHVRSNDPETTELNSSDPEWLRKIYRFCAATPFVAVFRSVPMPGGGEDLIVTPIQDHPILQSAYHQSRRSQPSSEDKGKGKVVNEGPLQTPHRTLHIPFRTSRSSSNTHMPAGSSRHDETHHRPGSNTFPIPVELFGLINKHLSYHDIKNMRLVNKAFEEGVSAYMFERVVLPFNQDIYGILTEDAQTRSLANVKGKARATEIPPELALDMFHGFGRHIRQFGISFDVDRQALANPPPKKMREGHKAYWGKYEWCFPDYVRFSDRAALEDAADQTTIMTKALSYLTSVQHLAISLDAGLGWLKEPGRSLRDRILDEQPAIWGGSRYHTDPYQAAHRRFWLTLQETFRTAGKLDDLYYLDLVHLDHPHIQSLVDAAEDMPSSIKMHKTLLANAFSTSGKDFRTEKQMIPKSILDRVPSHVWDEAGLGPMHKQMQHISWEAVWTEPVYEPLKKYLSSRTDIALPSPEELSSYIDNAPAESLDFDSSDDEEDRMALLNRAFADENRQPQSHPGPSRKPSLSSTLMKSLSRITEGLGKPPTRSKLELHSARSRAPNGILAVLPLAINNDDSTPRHRDRDASRFLGGPQKEWLLETAWAQDAFISSYMLAITDNRHMAANIKSLILTRFSSKHLPRLYRDDFWGALSSLTDLRLTIIADWRDVIYDVSSSAETTELSPAWAITSVHYLLTSQIVHKHSLRKLSLGWADGGEEAEGYFARNQNVLPVPLVPRERAINSGKVFAEMPIFRHLEELQLHNCWITPNMLAFVLDSHKNLNLQKLTLDSVSLTAHPGLAPTDNANINGQGIWAQVLMGLLPGLQRLGSGVPQPPGVITGVQQLARFATNAGVQLPPNVNQFIQIHPYPAQTAGTAPPTHPFLPNLAAPPIPPNNYQPVMTALDQALAPVQVQAQAVNVQQAAPVDTNNDGNRVGSWPDVLKKLTEMLDAAGKPDFEFAFLSCGYVLMPSTEFDQAWLRFLSKQVDNELNVGMTEDDDRLFMQLNIQNGQPQPQPQPIGFGQPAAGNNAQAQAQTRAQVQAQAPPPPNQAAQRRLALLANRRTMDDDFTDADPTNRGGRASMVFGMKLLAPKVQRSNDALLGRIISALPPSERNVLATDWADIELGWPTAAMGLVEEEIDKDSGAAGDLFGKQSRKGWGRWGERRKEAAVWDGQKEGGCGRFSGRIWAREGRVIVDEDEEGYMKGGGEKGGGSSTGHMAGNAHAPPVLDSDDDE